MGTDDDCRNNSRRANLPYWSPATTPPWPLRARVEGIHDRPQRRRFLCMSRLIVACCGGWLHGPADEVTRKDAGLLQVVPKLARTARVAQLTEGLCLDLAYPLAGHVELLANLLERSGAAVLEAKA
jgi:hypothetical protein